MDVRLSVGLRSLLPLRRFSLLFLCYCLSFLCVGCIGFARLALGLLAAQVFAAASTLSFTHDCCDARDAESGKYSSVPGGEPAWYCGVGCRAVVVLSQSLEAAVGQLPAGPALVGQAVASQASQGPNFSLTRVYLCALSHMLKQTTIHALSAAVNLHQVVNQPSFRYISSVFAPS